MIEKPGIARALAAARAVALANFVACDDAVVIAAGSNVLVHLKPASPASCCQDLQASSCSAPTGRTR
jgi:hypothetical protein